MRRTLEITTTVGCRVGCSYCPQRTFVRAQREASDVTHMPLETFSACLATVPANVEINFSGYAEPWLNLDATAMAERAAAAGHTLNVFSTLVGMTPGDVDRLFRLPLRVFRVHLPADGMRVVADAGYLATLRRVAHHPPGLPVELMAFGALSADILSAIGGTPVSFRHPISRAANVDPSIVRAPAMKTGRLRCAEERLWRNVLLPSGDVTLCCNDYGRTRVLGNLLTSSYAELFTGEPFRLVLERMGGAPGPLLCRSCEYAATVA